MKSGIYKITCLGNGKFYIGSSNNIKRRWREHKLSLRKNVHINLHLQNCWNKYGEKRFVFDILELVSEDKLFDVEQSYLDTLKSYDDKIGLNLSKLSHGPESNGLTKEYIVTLPNGDEIYVRNLNKFCRENGINDGCGLHQVARGEINQFNKYKARFFHQTKEDWEKTKLRSIKSGKGWKGKYKIKTPSGEEIIVLSLTKFCKENDLNQGNMASICRKERNQHKGYICEFFIDIPANA